MLKRSTYRRYQIRLFELSNTRLLQFAIVTVRRHGNYLVRDACRSPRPLIINFCEDAISIRPLGNRHPRPPRRSGYLAIEASHYNVLSNCKHGMVVTARFYCREGTSTGHSEVLRQWSMVKFTRHRGYAVKPVLKTTCHERTPIFKDYLM